MRNDQDSCDAAKCVRIQKSGTTHPTVVLGVKGVNIVMYQNYIADHTVPDNLLLHILKQAPVFVLVRLGACW